MAVRGLLAVTGLATGQRKAHGIPQGRSTSRFIRHFKTATGVTPGIYRLNICLNGARCLLAQGAALADTALAMGFADQSHLQRAFKALHAATPGCYAKQQLASL